jgi:hypothetical protein
MMLTPRLGGHLTSVESAGVGESRIEHDGTYVFDSKIQKQVTFDREGKVNDVYYSYWDADEEATGREEVEKL